LLALIFSACLAAAQQNTPASLKVHASMNGSDDFSGTELNEKNGSVSALRGGNVGTLKVVDGQLQMRSVSRRSSLEFVRKQDFNGDHFVINAVLARVGSGLPEPGQPSAPLGNAIVTVLF
jgi:hypothetical protein